MAKINDSKPNGYALSRAWFDFAFENQGVVSGNHGCMFLWFLEKNNRMGWVKQFGAPRDETMAAVGITSYNTYRKIFSDLVEWGFIKVIKESKNQYTANIIALSKNDQPSIQALDSALIQALTDHGYQHSSNTDTGTDTDSVAINKQETIKQKTLNNKNEDFINELVDAFGFTEMRFAKQQKEVMQFVNVIAYENTLDHFKIQHKNYQEFKKLSGQTLHSFKSFIGNIDKKFQDGAWNADNWAKKLETEKSKQNGKPYQKNPGLRSANASDGRSTFGKL